MTIAFPKNFGIESVDKFLKSSEIIFSLKHKHEKDFELNLSKINSICLLGQLLIYKFISYTSENECFIKPRLTFNPNHELEKKLIQYGFYPIIKTYIVSPTNEGEILKAYKKLKYFERDNVLITPQRLLRSEIHLKSIFEEELFNRIFLFYQCNDKSRLVCTAISELLSNFWSHATDDSGTVMVAMGNKHYMEICFADNGCGIITNLQSSNERYKKMSKEMILRQSLMQGVTSKVNSNHLGMGLYLIDMIAKKNNGYFRVISEGCEYIYGRNKEKVRKSGFWKGTIVYLRLELDKIVCIRDIKELLVVNKLSITWR